MADNAYNIGTRNLFDRLLGQLASFDFAATFPFFNIKDKLCGSDRSESDVFFSRDDSFTKSFNGVSSQPGAVSVEKQLHLVATLEQDHKSRYSCSRRHALITTVNNCDRLSSDIQTLYHR